MKTNHERHHNTLTEDDISALNPNRQLLHYLELFARESGKKPGNIKVLDFGCGRGALCVFLMKMGYDAHGVDIDKAGVEAGQHYMEQNGLNKDVLGTIDEEGATKFEDNYFDLIISNQVFEHLENIDQTIRECARLTKCNGWGLHSYPACYLPVEPHIFVPFVHWLPKNRIREHWIGICLLFKKPTKWSHLQDMTRKELAAYYANYLNKQTYYRTPSRVMHHFQKHGFDSKQVVITHPKIANIKLLRPVLKIALVSSFLNGLLGLFYQTDLWTVRRG